MSDARATHNRDIIRTGWILYKTACTARSDSNIACAGSVRRVGGILCNTGLMAIQVDENARLSKALDLHPDVLDYIVSLNPHDFQRLRNPLMRKLMPPRITLRRVAAMTRTPLPEMLSEIHRIAGKPLSVAEQQEIVGRAAVADSNASTSTAKPSWAEVEPSAVVDLLAGDERLDEDPLLPVMRAIRARQPGELVVIKHKWEPQPLYDIWDKAGVEHYAEQISADEWWIYVRRTPTGHAE